MICERCGADIPAVRNDRMVRRDTRWCSDGCRQASHLKQLRADAAIGRAVTRLVHDSFGNAFEENKARAR